MGRLTGVGWACTLLVCSDCLGAQADASERSCTLTPGPILTSQFATATDYFGYSVSTDGFSLIVGAPLDDIGATSTGSGSVFVRKNGAWRQEVLLAPIGAPNAPRAGFDVAIHGDIAVLGTSAAITAAGETGAIYVYRRTSTGWTYDGQFVPPDAQAFDRFGYALAVEPGAIYVGSLFSDAGGNHSGCVYVYREVAGSWELAAPIVPVDPEASSRFGYSLSLRGDRMLIGAPLHDANGPDAGAAYVYERRNGSFEFVQRLTASTPGNDTFFGGEVELDGDLAAITAPRSDVQGVDSGAAYVFRSVGGTWSQEAALTSPQVKAGDFFGYSIATAGGRVFVGSVFDDDRGEDAGAVYTFARSGGEWTETDKSYAPNASSLDRLGQSTAAWGDEVYVGALFGTASTVSSGALYTFTVDGCADFSVADVNCDSVTSVGDIAPFVLALTDAVAYATQYPDCFIATADVNGDGVVSVGDIAAFVAILTGG